MWVPFKMSLSLLRSVKKRSPYLGQRKVVFWGLEKTMTSLLINITTPKNESYEKDMRKDGQASNISVLFFAYTKTKCKRASILSEIWFLNILNDFLKISFISPGGRTRIRKEGEVFILYLWTAFTVWKLLCAYIIYYFNNKNLSASLHSVKACNIWQILRASYENNKWLLNNSASEITSQREKCKTIFKYTQWGKSRLTVLSM